jgi:hypothetical protein
LVLKAGLCYKRWMYLGRTGTVDDVVGVLDSVVARSVSVARHVGCCLVWCGLGMFLVWLDVEEAAEAVVMEED